MPFERGPYLLVAAFCEQVIEDKSGVLSLIRMVDRLQITAQGPEVPEEMPPTAINWTLVFTFKSGDARGTYAVRIEPVLPSGERMAPFTLSLHLEGGNRGQSIINRMNFPVKMPGVHWFKIYLDDIFLTQLPIEVIYSRIVISAPRE